jgi:hypothetical protein
MSERESAKILVRVFVNTDCPNCRAKVIASCENVSRGFCPVCKRKLKFRSILVAEHDYAYDF